MIDFYCTTTINKIKSINFAADMQGNNVNTFFEEYATPHETAPFDRIRFEDYEPAIMEGIVRDKALIDSIANNAETPTFKNTVAVVNEDNLLERASTVFFNLCSANTNDDMDALAQKLAPILQKHADDILFNEKLWQRVKYVYEHERGTLDPESEMLLEKQYDGYVRAGADLDEAGKEKKRRISEEMSVLSLQFSQNNLKETNAYRLHLTSEEDLDGLPESAREAAALAAKEAGLEGWVFTLHAPSLQPFMTYSNRRDLRQKMYMAKNTLSLKDNEYNNLKLVARMVNLRREAAQLMGYSTFADYVLAKRMAQNTEGVYRLVNQLLDAYLPAARKEVDEVEALAKRLEGDSFVMMPWDFGYYSHKLKLERYNLDAEMLRPYLELKRVKAGVFGLAERLYGIRFVENSDIPVYHPDVTAYDVLDRDGSFLAVLYADFFPREGKQSGAWMTSYREQFIAPDGENVRPHVSVTMNFTKPTESKPALLTLGEVETFLHEFGHALHGIFANTRYQSLSGTNVYWDFVELPSQFMENYVVEPEFLHTFAVHYQTGEPMPDALIERIVESRNFLAAYSCVRQLSFCLLDMAYYTLDKPFDEDVQQFEQKAWQRAQVLRPVEGTCMSVQFGHIMSGGYAAGYYSYKWAEVLDADAFAVFKREGIFNRETAQRFRDEVLSKGGTRHPAELYRNFRGGEPTIEALLKRNGLTKTDK